MSKTSLSPSTLLEEMLLTVSHQLLVRTMLSVSDGNYCHFSGHVFMGEGARAAGKPERLLHVRVDHGSSQIPARLSGLRIESGEAITRILAEWTAEQALRASEHDAPWFTSWLTKNQFEGILLLSSDQRRGPVAYRRLPSEHPALQVYFGAISAGLSKLASEREERTLGPDEERAAKMLTRLAERFGKFLWDQQRKLLESAVGNGYG